MLDEVTQDRLDDAAIQRIWLNLDLGMKPNRPQRRWLPIVVVGVSAALVAGGGSAFATAAVTNQVNQANAAQLSRVTDDLQTITGASDSVTTAPGFAGMSIDSADNTVDIYWNGTVPANVIAFIRAHPSVNFRVHEATASVSDVHAAGNRLLNYLTDDGDGHRIGFIDISPGLDGTLSATLTSLVPGVTLEEIQPEVDRAAGMHVDVTLLKYGDHTHHLTAVPFPIPTR